MKRIFIILFIICLTLYWLQSWRTQIKIIEQFIPGLPASIEAEGLAMQNVHTGLFSALVADSCGVTAIRITEATADKIRKDGQTFLESAMRSRSNSARRGRPIFYAAWEKMPTAKYSDESVFAAILSCSGRAGIPARQIIEGLEGGNGYASRNRGYNEFYILLDQRLFSLCIHELILVAEKTGGKTPALFNHDVRGSAGAPPPQSAIISIEAKLTVPLGFRAHRRAGPPPRPCRDRSR